MDQRRDLGSDPDALGLIARSAEKAASACQNLLEALAGAQRLDSARDQLIPITNPEELRAAGIGYPRSVHQWRWLFARRHENGLADAFRKVGGQRGRIVVNPARFIELMRNRRSS